MEATRVLRRFPLHLALIILMLIWLLPTIGLFVNSFRNPGEIATGSYVHLESEPGDVVGGGARLGPGGHGRLARHEK